MQMTLGQWLMLHPRSLVMQPYAGLRDCYGTDFDYETSKSRAYDWNRLRRERIVNDELGGQPILWSSRPTTLASTLTSGPIRRRASRSSETAW